MTTLSLLLEKYGVLLTLEQIGQLFQRSPAALRQQIARRAGVGADLERAALRRGRRIYFRAADVATLIDGGEI